MDTRNALADIDQTRICETSRFAEIPKDCKPGTKIAFLPKTFGNAQLPLLFVAVQCDMRYSVALTEGGVVCILRPLAPPDESPASAPAAASAQAPASAPSSAASR